MAYKALVPRGYFPGGCKGRRSSCPASCPANDPTVARAGLPPALPTWPGPGGSQSQGLLCPANDHAASSPGRHPPSGEAAANYRACWPRQWPGQKSQPPITPHPLALRLWSPPLPSRVTKDTAEGWSSGSSDTIPLTTDPGKQDHSMGLIHPKSHSQPVQSPRPSAQPSTVLP